ncbi:MAG: 2-C-methyl-D-erythritol 4-phosphate cytidylyltransferase [Candidatus Staskawiczbacteria bacterium]|nr:2-C-methyl-D-erythritol 4-phosphate cytidylyltransferase [Candidatus Staskawiczbacteria bacterium]
MEKELEIKKAIIPVAGLGTRFLPLSRAVPKEFLPLVDKPVIQHIVEEVKKSGITEIIFVVSPKDKIVLNYFKKSPDIEKVLVKAKKEQLLKELKDFEEIFKGISFSFVVQKDPNGDGHAILQAAKLAKKEPVAVSFGDDIIDSNEPALLQLINIFKTCGAPVVALKSLPQEKLPAYGVVSVEKIANNLFKIKKIIEKPDPQNIPSNLAVVGKYILTPEVFGYLKKAVPSKRGEIILAEVFDKMLSEGKVIYGYELKGEWLECGDKLKWIKSFFYLALKDSRYKEELKQYLKTIK